MTQTNYAEWKKPEGKNRTHIEWFQLYKAIENRKLSQQSRKQLLPGNRGKGPGRVRGKNHKWTSRNFRDDGYWNCGGSFTSVHLVKQFKRQLIVCKYVSIKLLKTQTCSSSTSIHLTIMLYLLFSWKVPCSNTRL